jgi:hypothetical protein
MTKDEATKQKIKDPGRYFRVFSGKRNFAPATDDSDWYHLESVPLHNGKMLYFMPDSSNGGDRVSLRAGRKRSSAFPGGGGRRMMLILLVVLSSKPVANVVIPLDLQNLLGSTPIIRDFHRSPKCGCTVMSERAIGLRAPPLPMPLPASMPTPI